MSRRQLRWSKYLDASWWRHALPVASPRWVLPVAANEDEVEQSGLFERPVPVPRAALLVLRAGVIALLLGRVGWFLIPATPRGVTEAVPGALTRHDGSSVGELLGHASVTWFLVSFYVACACLVATVGHATRAGRRVWLHDRLLMICSGLLCVSGLHGGGEPAAPRVLEHFATALLPMVWVLTRRRSQMRVAALVLARAGVVCGFLAHGLLFFDWQSELPLLGRLLGTDLGLGSTVTDTIMLGLCGLYAGLGSLILLGGWLRRLDRVLLGAAVTLGAFTAGIRICLGLEPGFFQASAAHWLLSTLLGAAVGGLPLFMALCADQRLVALGSERAGALLAPRGHSRRPGPLSAA